MSLKCLPWSNRIHRDLRSTALGFSSGQLWATTTLPPLLPRTPLLLFAWSYCKLNHQCRHYFSPSEIGDWLFTKLHNGFVKANAAPPLDRLFTVPRREALRKLGPKYPKYFPDMLTLDSIFDAIHSL